MILHKFKLPALLFAVSFSSFSEAQTQLYWGDTHLHTSYSPDAYLMQNRSADPDTAYAYAKGLPVIHPYHRARIQIETPLDFLVVSDHGEFLNLADLLIGSNALAGGAAAREALLQVLQNEGEQALYDSLVEMQANAPVDIINRTLWQRILEAAERHNNPGVFTAFVGWEWTSTPDDSNLHRVVIMKDGMEKGRRFMPFNSLDSNKPEDLWAWLDTTSTSLNTDFLAIPHNSNISQGKMFDRVDSAGNPITQAYAQTRMRWEPVMEATQIKGDSETHPQLSPNDVFADFETYEHLLSVNPGDEPPPPRPGSYARTALMRGLAIENQVGINPFKFGMIGSTDSHTGTSSAEENNFHGKTAQDSTPENKSEDVLPGVPGWEMGAGGLAAVWAEENTREALFNAMKRKEVYASTGPRIALRFFGGFDFESSDGDLKDIAEVGYRKGVSMGGDLMAAPAGRAPGFLIRAVKDPKGANLDRIQVVKGWLNEQGIPQQKVFNVIASDERVVDEDGNVPPVGNTVNLQTGHYSNSIGDPELVTVWHDPEFSPLTRAFYYARVLQIPTPRHTLYDTIALQQAPETSGRPATIQDRAYSSPIWYTP